MKLDLVPNSKAHNSRRIHTLYSWSSINQIIRSNLIYVSDWNRNLSKTQVIESWNPFFPLKAICFHLDDSNCNNTTFEG